MYCFLFPTFLVPSSQIGVSEYSWGCAEACAALLGLRQVQSAQTHPSGHWRRCGWFRYIPMMTLFFFFCLWEESWPWLLCLCLHLCILNESYDTCLCFQAGACRGQRVLYVFGSNFMLAVIFHSHFLPSFLFLPHRQSECLWRRGRGRREQEREGAAEQRCARDRHLRLQRSVHVSVMLFEFFLLLLFFVMCFKCI